jgi:hypothetical protein
MHRPALRRVGGAVDSGARQRVAEGHAFLERQQPVGRVDGGERDAEALAGALQEQRIADWIGRCDEQQAARVGGEKLEAPDVARLDPPGDRAPPACRTRPPTASASIPAAARAARAGSRMRATLLSDRP